MASRLSEVSSFKVLLIEAGPSYVVWLCNPRLPIHLLSRDLDYHNIFVPLNASTLTPSILSWNYSYVPTPYVDNRAIFIVGLEIHVPQAISSYSPSSLAVMFSEVQPRLTIS